MFYRLLILVIVLSLFVVGCGGDSGQENANGGNSAPVSVDDISGTKLTLTSGAAFLESDYYLYSDGTADYILRSANNPNPSIFRLQWTLEGQSLFVNNGSKKLGSGLTTPKEIQFDSAPSIGDAVRVKAGNSVASEYVIIDIQEAIKAEIILTKEDFVGKAYEFSPNGSTSYASLVRLSFDDDTNGVWKATHHVRAFTWSIVSANRVRLDYSNGDYSEYEFRFGIELGDHVYTHSDYDLGHILHGETIFVNVYSL